MRKNSIASIQARVIVKNQCHIWTGRPDPYCGGYGKVNFEGKEWLAHRLFAKWAGLDIDNKVVMHSCDTPLCCNPDHLSVGLPIDNNNDKINKRRHRHMFSDDEVRFLRTASTEAIMLRFNLDRQHARHARWRAKHKYKQVV